jgi:hypothetical protein
MKKNIIILSLLVSPCILFSQKGYLGKKFSAEFSNNLGNRGTFYTDLKMNYVLGKKVEIFGQFGTSLNSFYYIDSDLSNLFSNDRFLFKNMNFELGKTLSFPTRYHLRQKTDVKLSIIQYGAGIRFYRKTKLAPVGKFIEISYSNITATPSKSSFSYAVMDTFDDTTFTTHNDKFTSSSINQINLGFHRKRVLKEGWYISSGFNIPFRWRKNLITDWPYIISDSLDLVPSLKLNFIYFNLTVGKMLF